MTEGKVCKYCYQFQSYNLFRKVKKCSDGYRNKCKDCERPMKQLHYQNNKEKYKQDYNEFMERNPLYFIERKTS